MGTHSWDAPTWFWACIAVLVMKVRVRKDVPAPVPLLWGTQSRDPWHDIGRRGAGHAGHGIRAWGYYLFPVHQEENTCNKLRDEDEAHKDEELKGSGMKESETSPTMWAACSSYSSSLLGHALRP